MTDFDTDMLGAPYNFVVERLQLPLPNKAALVAKIADVKTKIDPAAPHLTDHVLTPFRPRGAPRQSSAELSGEMIEIDAYRMHDTRGEIDGRFGSQQ